MKLKKLLSLAIVTVISIGMLAGCSKEKAVVRMATNAEFPPFEFMVENGISGKFDGIDVAIALEIAKSMDKELQIDNMEFISILAAITSGSADFAIAGMTSNAERLESVDFSIPYFKAAQVIVVKADNETIKSANDILDKKVGAIEGYTGAIVCKEIGVADLQTYKKGLDAVMEVQQGRIDAAVIDSHTAIALTKKNSDIKIVEDPEVFETEEYAVAVKKGDKEMLDKVNKVLENLISTGKIEEYVAKYSTEE